VLSDLIGLALGIDSAYIATDAGPDKKHLGDGPLYSWANFDEIGNSQDPDFQSVSGTMTYTTMTDEVTDIKDFARALYLGPSNLMEWYFSNRRIVDMIAATLPFGPRYGLNFIHSDQVGNLPKKEFIASDGIFRSELTDMIIPIDEDRIPGYNHLDVVLSSANTPSHRENEVIEPLINFIITHAK